MGSCRSRRPYPCTGKLVFLSHSMGQGDCRLWRTALGDFYSIPLERKVSKICRIMGWFKVGRALGISTPNNLTKARSSLNELFKALCSWVLKTCKDRVYRNPGSLSHCLAVLVVKKSVPNIQSEYCLSFSHHAPLQGPWLYCHEDTTRKTLPIIFLQCLRDKEIILLSPQQRHGAYHACLFRNAAISLPRIHGTATDWMQKETVGGLVGFKQSWNGLRIWKSNQASLTVVILWTGECFLQCPAEAADTWTSCTDLQQGGGFGVAPKAQLSGGFLVCPVSLVGLSRVWCLAFLLFWGLGMEGVFLCKDFSLWQWVQLCADDNRRVKPPCDTVVKQRKKPQLGGLSWD